MSFSFGVNCSRTPFIPTNLPELSNTLIPNVFSSAVVAFEPPSRVVRAVFTTIRPRLPAIPRLARSAISADVSVSEGAAMPSLPWSLSTVDVRGSNPTFVRLLVLNRTFAASDAPDNLIPNDCITAAKSAVVVSRLFPVASASIVDAFITVIASAAFNVCPARVWMTPATGPKASAMALPENVDLPAVARNASPIPTAAAFEICALPWIFASDSCIAIAFFTDSTAIAATARATAAPTACTDFMDFSPSFPASSPTPLRALDAEMSSPKSKYFRDKSLTASSLLLLHLGFVLVDRCGVPQPDAVRQVPDARRHQRVVWADARPQLGQRDQTGVDASPASPADAVAAATGRFTARPEPARVRAGFVGRAGFFLSCGSSSHVRSRNGKSIASPNA